MSSFGIKQQGGAPVNSNPTFDGVTLNGGPLIEVPVVLTDAATVTTNAALGNTFLLTTTQTFTLANPTNPVNGQKILYKIKQGGSGSNIITYGTKFRGSNDLALPILTTTLNDADFLAFYYDSAVDFWDLMAYNRGFAS